ncbi:hypothetical protein FHW88_005219 [Mucilaginibacter sp. SG538B]|nr:hypothetical protein [Mucilaginibacter sp. SG538B]
MKTQKLKLTESKVLKVYGNNSMYIGTETTTSNSTTGDPTTYCSTVTSTTHLK